MCHLIKHEKNDKANEKKGSTILMDEAYAIENQKFFFLFLPPNPSQSLIKSTFFSLAKIHSKIKSERKSHILKELKKKSLEFHMHQA